MEAVPRLQGSLRAARAARSCSFPSRGRPCRPPRTRPPGPRPRSSQEAVAVGGACARSYARRRHCGGKAPCPSTRRRRSRRARTCERDQPRSRAPRPARAARRRRSLRRFRVRVALLRSRPSMPPCRRRATRSSLRHDRYRSTGASSRATLRMEPRRRRPAGDRRRTAVPRRLEWSRRSPNRTALLRRAVKTRHHRHRGWLRGLFRRRCSNSSPPA